MKKILTSAFLMLCFTLTVNAQRRIELPCLEDMFGECINRISVTITGPSTANLNTSHYYYVNVDGGSHYGTSYTVSGGTILSQSKTYVRVKWTSIGSNRYIRANVSTSMGAQTRYKYVNVSCALPTVYNVTGGGSYCPGENGVTIGLSDSQSGASYQLKRNGSNVGSPKAGTGNAISFGKRGAGTYTVVASKNGCSSTMNGSKTVFESPNPTKYTVTGGGDLCHAPGFVIGLSDSDRGAEYQLRRNGTNVGGVIGGTGNAINWGVQTIAGTYDVTARYLLTGCTTEMNNTRTISYTPPSLPATTVSTNTCGPKTISQSLFPGQSIGYWQTSPTGTSTNNNDIVYTVSTTGTYYLRAKKGSCWSNARTFNITINQEPAQYSVTGGGSFCENEPGVPIGLNGSQNGVNYQLKRNGSSVGSPIPGTGNSLNFGIQTAAGTYTVEASNSICSSTMSGDKTVTRHLLPFIYGVTGSGSYCSGGTGIPIGLNDSQTFVSYQLRRNGVNVGGAITGTGSSLSFGNQTVAGTYDILATNTSTGCNRTMGNQIITIDPLPNTYNVTGGGSYCSGDTGVAIPIGLDGSQVDADYQLVLNGTPTGSPIPGTGSAISFGNHTTDGVYQIVATNSLACSKYMYGDATIVVNPLPTSTNVTGGGSFCEGGSGVSVGLNRSYSGTSYQLLLNGSPIGSPESGTGTSISFGNQTSVGVYTVLATDNGTLCTRQMNGDATVVFGNPSMPDEPTIVPGFYDATITRTSPPLGETWYWQGTDQYGESIDDSSEQYVATQEGTYYLRALTDAGCWGESRPINVNLSRPFITTWNVTSKRITIPVALGSGYNYSVSWIDQQGNETQVGVFGLGDATINFPDDGVYQVLIRGAFPQISFKNDANSDKIISVDQWGDIEWRSMEDAFLSCNNLHVNATDKPDLSMVTSLSGMFSFCESFNEDIGHWDVETIEDMSFMFQLASSFNQDISTWDVRNVTNMEGMFNAASSFDQDLSAWNVSSVRNMKSMFNSASAFNSPLSWGNNTREVRNMEFMFRSATIFNQNIGGWDVSNATNMKGMFSFARAFNSPIDAWGNKTSSVTDMSNMFQSASDFNQDLSLLDVSSVTDMSYMFNGATNFNSPLDWASKTSSVTDMTAMFASADSFDKDISQWNVSNVESMKSMFSNASSFNSPLNFWGNKTSMVTDMSNMFASAISFNQDISSWDVSSVENMSGMFFEAENFNSPLNGWGNKTGSVTNMSSMFRRTTMFNQAIDTWDVSNVTSMYSMFFMTDFNQDISGWQTNSLTNMDWMFAHSEFNQDLSAWNTSNITNMFGVFSQSSFNQNLGSWNISNVANMTHMFRGADMSEANYELTLQGWVSQPSVPANIRLGANGITYCDQTYRDQLVQTYGWEIIGDQIACANTIPFISIWKTDNNGGPAVNQVQLPVVGLGINYTVYWEDVNDPGINGTFSSSSASHSEITFPYPGTYRLEISGIFPGFDFKDAGSTSNSKLLSVEQWGDNKWAYLKNAFYNCANFELNATDNPDLRGVSSLTRMFERASSFNSDISSWDVRTIEDMSYMFAYAELFDQDISSWNVQNVSNMAGMFFFATAFNGALNSWGNTTSSVTNTTYMFYRAAAFNQPLDSWDVSSVTTMYGMFFDATSFNQDINGWDVDLVQDMGAMFDGAFAFNQDISSWNVGNVTSMGRMFKDATSFNQNLGTWDISNMDNMVSMLDNTNLSVSNYDNTLIGWSTVDPGESIPSRVRLGAKGLRYCAGESARDVLTNISNRWTIENDLLECPTPPTTAASTNDEFAKKQISEQSQDEASFEMEVSLYPNPAHDFFIITGSFEDSNIIVYDLNGKEVLSRHNLNGYQITIDVNQLKDGVYVLKVTGVEGQIHQRKLVVKH